MILSALIFAGATAPAVHIDPAQPERIPNGTVRIGTSPAIPAYLHVGCPYRRDTLPIQLVVPEARSRTDFDFGDFAGAEAPANLMTLTDISWTAASGTLHATGNALGSYQITEFGPFEPRVPYLRVEPTWFRFERTNSPDEWRRFVSAMQTEAGTLTWTQTAYGDFSQKLTATFEFSVDGAKQFTDVAACLLSGA